MAYNINNTKGQTLNREDLLKMAIRAAQSGNSTASRMMFGEVLDDDPRNERALMWMAKLADTKAERVKYLNMVLAVNPLNENASSALRKLQYSKSARDNRVLLIFGVVAVVLIVLAAVVIITQVIT